MALLQNSIVPAAAASDEEVVTRSLRFEDDAYLSFTPATATSTRQKAVINFWFKIAEPESSSARYCVFFSAGNVQGSGTEWFGIHYNANTGKLHISDSMGVAAMVTTDAVYRDYGSFYNLHLILDSTQSTSTDRLKLYINGELQSLTGTYPTLNQNFKIGTAAPHRFGYQDNSPYHGTTFGPQVYIANAYVLENSTLSYTDFIEDNGYGGYKPKATSGLTFGTNGFHLKFEDNTNIGEDSTSNGNDFTATNLASHDVVLDRPSNNYATLNPLAGSAVGTTRAMPSEGNLKLEWTSGDSSYQVQSTIGFSSGKFYYEAYINDTYGAGADLTVGVNEASSSLEQHAGGDAYSVSFSGNGNGSNGSLRFNSNTTNYGTGFTDGALVMIACDADTGKVWFGVNGTWTGDPANGTSPACTLSGDTFFAAVRAYAYKLTLNFGQDPTFANQKPSGQDTSQSEFYYAPPSGFKALSTANLDDPTVTPHENFEAVTYSGTGSAQNITTEFQPSLTWVKRRDSSANNILTDSARGANKALSSNTTSTEDTSTSLITALNSTSFGVGTDSKVNASGGTYVGWNWKESATAGMDIVTWTGNSANTYGSSSKQTVSHSLGVSPDMIIAKARSQDSGNYAGSNLNWVVWHKDLSSSRILNLNNTYSQSQHEGNLISGIGTSSIDFGNDLSWSYETLNIDYSDYGMNADTYVAYLFSGVEGFSKFGKYTGNGSSDGPFIYCGFRPAFVMHKEITTSSYDWVIHDTARDTTNDSTWNHLIANQSDAENGSNAGPAAAWADIVSNGWKLRTSSTEHGNGSGKTYIYAAFAEQPFSAPSNAR